MASNTNAGAVELDVRAVIKDTLITGLVALAIDAPCHHNSQQGRELPAAFHASAAVLRARWPERLPLATPCMLLR